MKKCIKCGAELPDHALFCHKCATSQVRTVPVSMPRKGRWIRPALCVVLAALLLLLGAGGHALLTRNRNGQPAGEQPAAQTPVSAEAVPEERQVIDAGGPELEFNGYRLVLSFYGDSARQGDPTEARTVSLTRGISMSAPTLLTVFDRDGTPAWDSFREQIDSTSVQLETAAENRISCTRPAFMEEFPEGDLASRLEFDSDAGETRIIWNLELKTGEVLRLSHTFTVEELGILDFYAESTPMNTMEELQQLLQTIRETVEPETVVNLYLPPVTYEGTLVLDRAVNLLGALDGQTVIRGSVQVYSEAPDFGSIQNIRFEGAGGVGLLACHSVRLSGCSFSGYEIGVQAVENGWAALDACTFEENGIGVQYNMNSYHYFDSEIWDCSFLENETAIQVLQIPSEAPVHLHNAAFRGNTTDLDNPANYPFLIQ